MFSDVLPPSTILRHTDDNKMKGYFSSRLEKSSVDIRQSESFDDKSPFPYDGDEILNKGMFRNRKELHKLNPAKETKQKVVTFSIEGTQISNSLTHRETPTQKSAEPVPQKTLHKKTKSLPEIGLLPLTSRNHFSSLKTTPLTNSALSGKKKRVSASLS
jgi:hypothetical protein